MLDRAPETSQTDLAADERARFADRLNPDFPKRVVLIERSMLVVLIAGLLVGVAAILKPFTAPILFGGIIAAATWPLRQFLLRHRIGRGLAAVLLFVLSLVIILVPVLIIAPHLPEQLAQAARRFEAFFGAAPAKPAWLEGVPLIGPRLGAGWERAVQAEGDLRTLLEPYTARVEQWAVGAAATLGDSLLQLVLSLVAAAMFWANGDGLLAVLHDSLNRLGGPVAERALSVAAGAVRGVVYGVIGTAVIQAAVLTFGLAIAGIPGAAMLGFIGLLLAISQVGAPLLILIWGGASWWLFRNGHSGWGTFMIPWGVFVSIVDNLIRPWLIGFGIDMPLSLTIVGVFGGFVAFGFLGLFVGPSLLAIVYTLLKAWRTAIAAHPETAPARSPSRTGALGLDANQSAAEPKPATMPVSGGL